MPARSTDSTTWFERLAGGGRGFVLGALLEFGLRFGDLREQASSRSDFWALDAEFFQFPMAGLVLGAIWPGLTWFFMDWFSDDDEDRRGRDRSAGAGIAGVLLALALVAVLGGIYVLYLHRPAGR